jgi:hypothetical protein
MAALRQHLSRGVRGMPEAKIIVRSSSASIARLPNTVVLPDGKKREKMGSGYVTRMICSGSQAVIYEIWNPDLEVRRAVKLLHPDHTPESERRFQTEMRISAKLHHPNIVEIYGVGMWNGLPYIEMEEIDGCTLQQLIARRGHLPVEAVAALSLMIGRALDYAHHQTYVLYGKEYSGIIHRDLKPSNIMITRDGVVKLMDFGIARPATASMHTCQGMMVGTLQYVAPEQLSGIKVDLRTDIYSLGAVVYEMLTGVRTFPNPALSELVPDIMANRYAALGDFALKIPASLSSLVHRCLRADRDKRVQNTQEFLSAVSRVYSRRSALAPEKVVAKFLNAETSEKQVARRRLHRPVVPALIWSCTAIAVIGAAAIVVANLRGSSNRKQAAAQEHQVLAPAAATDRLPAAAVSAEIWNEFAVATPARPKAAMPAAQTLRRNDTSVCIDSTRPQRAPSRAALPVDLREPVSFFPPPEAAQSAAVSKTAEDPAPAADAVPPQSPIDQLKEKYATSDLLEIMRKEWEAGEAERVLLIYQHLLDAHSRPVRAILYAIRAYKKLGKTKELAALFSDRQVNDGEFYIEKASCLRAAGELDAAAAAARQASIAPVLLLDQQVFQENLLHLTAILVTAQFDANPSDDSRRLAMEAWYNVKSRLRASPDHPQYRQASDEIRRISKTTGG